VTVEVLDRRSSRAWRRVVLVCAHPQKHGHAFVRQGVEGDAIADTGRNVATWAAVGVVPSAIGASITGIRRAVIITSVDPIVNTAALTACREG
jgi:hypothetical protein